MEHEEVIGWIASMQPINTRFLKTLTASSLGVLRTRPISTVLPTSLLW